MFCNKFYNKYRNSISDVLVNWFLALLLWFRANWHRIVQSVYTWNLSIESSLEFAQFYNRRHKYVSGTGHFWVSRVKSDGVVDSAYSERSVIRLKFFVLSNLCRPITAQSAVENISGFGRVHILVYYKTSASRAVCLSAIWDTGSGIKSPIAGIRLKIQSVFGNQR